MQQVDYIEVEVEFTLDKPRPMRHVIVHPLRWPNPDFELTPQSTLGGYPVESVDMPPRMITPEGAPRLNVLCFKLTTATHCQHFRKGQRTRVESIRIIRRETPELSHLKAVIEGQPGLPYWEDWFKENRTTMENMLSAGQVLRLQFHPMKEIPAILTQHNISFIASDFYEWIDSDSKSGRCKRCGALIERLGHGWSKCSQGCWVIMT